ncbi:UbiA family prenyltransferase [Frigoribacterium sp. CFBP 13707]|uniref:UbiA family prenyltransferase n=1 Tax=Frigoribacterium sp. CFBP 13707 TaxID=2775313 RepID=UPI00177EB234|nr:UbiA family prenyltransferase [Frigoribacterium sp. CFBP 13707]MBD8727153.1 UbiA family prenyltransferase [Frigoribacterium sp. CFBP 13707]
MSTVSALVRSTHPGPTATVALLSLVLGLAVSLEAAPLVVVTVAVLAGQVSIGLSNDLVDLDRDRSVGRADKPVALGQVSPGVVGAAAVASLVVGVAAPFLLSVPAGLAHLVLVASGWAYNLGLKRTAASVVPFVVSFGLLPAVVTLALTPPAPPAAWALGVGAVFGVAIHFTNVLPDLGDDAATGVAGLPHRLGRLPAGVVAFAALAVAACLTLAGQLGSGATAAGPVVAVLGFVVVLGIAAAGTVVVVRGGDTRLLFRLIIVAALVLVGQLALSGAAIVA